MYEYDFYQGRHTGQEIDRNLDLIDPVFGETEWESPTPDVTIPVFDGDESDVYGICSDDIPYDTTGWDGEKKVPDLTAVQKAYKAARDAVLDYGLGSSAGKRLSSSDNLNDIHGAGFYSWPNNDIPTNAPDSTNSYSMLVVSYSNSYTTQIAFQTTGNIAYKRGKVNSSTWTAWQPWGGLLIVNLPSHTYNSTAYTWNAAGVTEDLVVLKADFDTPSAITSSELNITTGNGTIQIGVGINGTTAIKLYLALQHGSEITATAS